MNKVPARLGLFFCCILSATCFGNAYKIPSKLAAGLEISVKDGYDDLSVHSFLAIIKQLPDDSLLPLTQEPFYKNNISHLVNGSQPQRLVAYELIGRLRDTAYYNTLLQRMDTLPTFQDSYELPFAVMKLFPAKTDLMFEFILKNETFGDVIWTPTFMQTMERKSILTTAYAHVDDPRKMAHLLAMAIIANRDTTAAADRLLLQTRYPQETHLSTASPGLCLLVQHPWYRVPAPDEAPGFFYPAKI